MKHTNKTFIDVETREVFKFEGCYFYRDKNVESADKVNPIRLDIYDYKEVALKLSQE